MFVPPMTNTHIALIPCTNWSSAILEYRSGVCPTHPSFTKPLDPSRTRYGDGSDAFGRVAELCQKLCQDHLRNRPESSPGTRVETGHNSWELQALLVAWQRLAIAVTRFPKLDVRGSNPLARFRLATNPAFRDTSQATGMSEARRSADAQASQPNPRPEAPQVAGRHPPTSLQPAEESPDDIPVATPTPVISLHGLPRRIRPDARSGPICLTGSRLCPTPRRRSRTRPPPA
jgi:hypothetical protein